ncbi:hypothetical protein [Occultella kanbiaonis]|nr:hypothetical protein [Occultella kanbiaonis]
MTSTAAPRAVMLRSSVATVNSGVAHSPWFIAALRDLFSDAEIIL